MLSIDIAAVQKSLQQDDNRGKYFWVYYPDSRYWGRLEKVFTDDVDQDVVSQAEFKFLHYSCGYWDFPKAGDDVHPKIIDADYVMMGPCTPAETKSNGYKFSEDPKAILVYNALKRQRKN